MRDVEKEALCIESMKINVMQNCQAAKAEI